MDRETIIKIADLCKLHLTDKEIEMYTEQFQKILNYMAQIEEVDVEGIEPYMTPVTGNLREDEVRQFMMLMKEEVLNRAYNHDDNYVLVPKVSVK